MTPETVAEIRASLLRKPGRSAAQAFWIDGGEAYVTPEALDWPEGFAVGQALREALGIFSRVLEIGCGTGRLGTLFEPHEYVGVDINPGAIAIAMTRLPGHDFRLHDIGLPLPAADAVFFFNVLLHVPDDEIHDRLSEACAGRARIVIAEMMDRRWRRGGKPPVFNRDPPEYREIMQKLGFEQTHRVVRICQRYNVMPWIADGPAHFTLLTFEGEKNDGTEI